LRVFPRLTTLLLSLIVTGCADLPSAPDTIPGDMLADCRWNPDGSASCDPVESAPDTPPECDPYLMLGGCGDNCEMSAPEIDDPEYIGLAGCNDSGPANPGPGDDEDLPDGGFGTPDTGEEPKLTPYDEGPFLWAACVLAVVGSAYSVEVVGNKFAAWYDAHKALVSARRALDIAREMQQNGYVFEPATLQLMYYQLDQAVMRRDDAVGAVEEATGVSILTLIAAGFACGAAAAAPTP
jgi:hypothetical protein